MSRHQRHAENVRRQAIAILGGRCVRCGIDDPIVLDIDHKHGGGNIRRKLGEHHRMLERRIIAGTADLADYQILCANCHRYKTHEDRKKINGNTE